MGRIQEKEGEKLSKKKVTLADCIATYHDGLEKEFIRLQEIGIACRWGTLGLDEDDILPRWSSAPSKRPTVGENDILILGVRESTINEHDGFSIFRENHILHIIKPSYRLERGKAVFSEKVSMKELRKGLNKFRELDRMAREKKPSLTQCHQICKSTEKKPIMKAGKGLVGYDTKTERWSIFEDRVQDIEQLLEELNVHDGKVRTTEARLISLLNHVFNLGYRTATIDYWPTAEEEKRRGVLEKRDRSYKISEHEKTIAPALKNHVRKLIKHLAKGAAKKPPWKLVESKLRELCVEEAANGPRRLCWIQTKHVRKKESEAIQHRDDDNRPTSLVTFSTIREWWKTNPEPI